MYAGVTGSRKILKPANSPLMPCPALNPMTFDNKPTHCATRRNEKRVACVLQFRISGEYANVERPEFSGAPESLEGQRFWALGDLTQDVFVISEILIGVQ